MSILCRLGFHDWELVVDPETRRYTDLRACLRCRRVEELIDSADGTSSCWVSRGTAKALFLRRRERMMAAQSIASDRESERVE